MRKADGETPWPAAADPWPDTPPPFSTCRVFPCSARSVGDTPRVSKRKSRGTSLSVPASPKNGGGDEAEAPAGSAKKGPNALPLFDATDGAVGLSFGAAARSITQPPPAKRQKQQSAPASSVDDEAFARALQEEENARYELERTESRRRGEEWRRQHEEMMFAADDLDELLDEDDEEDLESQDMATVEEDGETEVVADGQLSADSAAAAHRAARREAAQRARARVGQMHRFFGQMHAHIHAAGATPGERGDLAALCFSDRDFTDADYDGLFFRFVCAPVDDKKVTPRRRSRRLHRRRARAREDDPHDQTVQRQGFGEDEDEQDPGEQLGLLRVRAHARVACDADGHPSREAGKTARQAGGEVRVPLEQGVPLGVNVRGDYDRDDESVDPQHPGHHDRDDRLHHELGAHHAHGGDAHPRLRGAVRRAHAREHQGGHGPHEPEKRRNLIAVGGVRARGHDGDDGQEQP
eukprot:CAMPEP_0117644168 /NCGR_PEP_ID=MMETSP0802-20121206/10837_1 /TAXON_ID=38833 /ORGANISM="Micromonas sp., Strain CCMP2099" /LENGTH=465 /DNA_ID=CAMNT_0005449391 /DNA_START=98 /DNA_END=1496 /DNA_ORIENTATION=+